MAAANPVYCRQVERYPCNFKLQVIPVSLHGKRYKLEGVLFYALQSFPAADVCMLVPAAEVR
jgi:hypothetical protein